VIFIFRYLEADSQMEVAVVAFQVSSHTEVIFIFLAFGGRQSDGGGHVCHPG
jgi:hypothetical protein